MKMSKDPLLENISPAFGSSFKVHNYKEANNDHAPTWHFHPEIELVYVNGGTGKRHIGNHISHYHNGDLILIGSNLPHFGFTDRLTGNKSEVVIQTLDTFLGDHFFEIPEMVTVKQLLERSKQGIAFSGNTKRIVGDMMEQLLEMSNFEQLLAFLMILKTLAESEEYTLLNVENVVLETKPQDTKRLDKVYSYVSQEFTRHITLSEMAALVSMTDQAFSRYFKSKTGKTFTQFVNEYRLVHACKLLSEEDMTITDVCYASGFNNFSHFNKKFKEHTGESPSAYRNKFNRVLK